MRLSINTSFRPSYVGRAVRRDDEVVCVPIRILNNSNAYALNVEFDVLMRYARGSEVSLNEYLRQHSQIVPSLNRLEPGGKWESGSEEFCLSTINGAVEAYRSGREECKVEIDLSWQDIRRRRHALIHVSRLTYALPQENSGGYFWLREIATYETSRGLLGAWDVKRHFGLPVD